MASVISHAVAGVALGAVLRAPGPPTRFWLAGALCAVAPDVDVIGVWLGVPWGHVLGHRGITHSLPFAAVLAAAVATLAFRDGARQERRGALWGFLFVATASHGVLDAMTDGGSGVAFLAPFDDTRYFLPWRPIPVSPISVHAFLSEWGVEILLAEAVWVWLPATILVAASAGLRARRRSPR